MFIGARFCLRFHSTWPGLCCRISCTISFVCRVSSRVSSVLTRFAAVAKFSGLLWSCLYNHSSACFGFRLPRYRAIQVAPWGEDSNAMAHIAGVKAKSAREVLFMYLSCMEEGCSKFFCCWLWCFGESALFKYRLVVSWWVLYYTDLIPRFGSGRMLKGLLYGSSMMPRGILPHSMGSQCFSTCPHFFQIDGCPIRHPRDVPAPYRFLCHKRFYQDWK